MSIWSLPPPALIGSQPRVSRRSDRRRRGRRSAQPLARPDSSRLVALTQTVTRSPSRCLRPCVACERDGAPRSRPSTCACPSAVGSEGTPARRSRWRPRPARSSRRREIRGARRARPPSPERDPASSRDGHSMSSARRRRGSGRQVPEHFVAGLQLHLVAADLGASWLTFRYQKPLLVAAACRRTRRCRGRSRRRR